MTVKSDAKVEEKKLLMVWKMTRGIWQVFTRAQVSKLGF